MAYIQSPSINTLGTDDDYRRDHVNNNDDFIEGLLLCVILNMKSEANHISEARYAYLSRGSKISSPLMTVLSHLRSQGGRVFYPPDTLRHKLILSS